MTLQLTLTYSSRWACWRALLHAPGRAEAVLEESGKTRAEAKEKALQWARSNGFEVREAA